MKLNEIKSFFGLSNFQKKEKLCTVLERWGFVLLLCFGCSALVIIVLLILLLWSGLWRDIEIYRVEFKDNLWLRILEMIFWILGIFLENEKRKSMNLSPYERTEWRGGFSITNDLHIGPHTKISYNFRKWQHYYDIIFFNELCLWMFW